MAERPEFFPEWAENDTNLPNTGKINKQRPKLTLREVGFDKGQEISAEEFNWQFNNIGGWVQFLEQEITEGISSTRDVNVNAGNGLTGGGNLAGDITITMGSPSTTSVNTTNSITLTSHTHSLDLSGRTVTGVNGLTGGGDLGANRTISLGTPSTITTSSANTNTGSTHNHQIDLSGRSITAGNGLTGGGDLGANRTISLGTPGTLTSSTNSAVTSASHTHAVDITGFFSNNNQSLGSQGWQVIPGGLLLQWGDVVYGDIVNTTAITVNFPKLFGAIFQVVANVDSAQPATVNVNNLSNNGFTALLWETSTVNVGGNVRWFAIGKVQM